jgi:hypothetical protein
LKTYFFKTGDAQSLPMLDYADELRRFENGIMSPGIQPCRSASEFLNLESAGLKIAPIQAGDF